MDGTRLCPWFIILVLSPRIKEPHSARQEQRKKQRNIFDMNQLFEVNLVPSIFNFILFHHKASVMENVPYYSHSWLQDHSELVNISERQAEDVLPLNCFLQAGSLRNCSFYLWKSFPVLFLPLGCSELSLALPVLSSSEWFTFWIFLSCQSWESLDSILSFSDQDPSLRVYITGTLDHCFTLQ